MPVTVWPIQNRLSTRWQRVVVWLPLPCSTVQFELCLVVIWRPFQVFEGKDTGHGQENPTDKRKNFYSEENRWVLRRAWFYGQWTPSLWASLTLLRTVLCDPVYWDDPRRRWQIGFRALSLEMIRKIWRATDSKSRIGEKTVNLLSCLCSASRLRQSLKFLINK